MAGLDFWLITYDYSQLSSIPSGIILRYKSDDITSIFNEGT
jgi:hypothetical protein